MEGDEVRVVVVDDLVDAADMIARALRLDGYQVRTAHDGNEALLLIEQYEPHCVLFDIAMPGLDGCELSVRLRERYGDDIVLIAVTGWDHQHSRVADTFARVDHYLIKPVDPAVLRRLLPPLRT